MALPAVPTLIGVNYGRIQIKTIPSFTQSPPSVVRTYRLIPARELYVRTGRRSCCGCAATDHRRQLGPSQTGTGSRRQPGHFSESQTVAAHSRAESLSTAQLEQVGHAVEFSPARSRAHGQSVGGADRDVGRSWVDEAVPERESMPEQAHWARSGSLSSKLIRVASTASQGRTQGERR